MSSLEILSTIIFVTCVVLGGHRSVGSEAERRLRKDLFANYSKDVRPVLNDNETVTVSLAIQLDRLLRIDENGQFFEFCGWITQSWGDSQLSWKKSKYNNIKKINMKPDKLWRPDINIKDYINDANTDHGGYMNRFKSDIIVYSDGSIEWATRSILKVGCAIDVYYYPLDRQVCSVEFESWIYDTSIMKIVSDRPDNYSVVDTRWYKTNLKWEFIASSWKGSEYNLPCCPNEKYSYVEFKFTFKRAFVFYVSLLIFSIGLITALMTFAFVLPGESGERMGMAFTLMLAALVFILLVVQSMPLNISSGGVPIIAVYFIFCMVLMTIMIIALAIVSRLYHRETDAPISSWTRRNILDVLSYIVRIQKCKANLMKSEGSKENLTVHRANFSDDSMNMTHLDDIENSRNNGVNNAENEGGKTEQPAKEDKGCDGTDDRPMFKIEWRIVAMTIDRCLFLFFMALFIIGTASCLALRPPNSR